jgi:two-component sensor histidine kinase
MKNGLFLLIAVFLQAIASGQEISRQDADSMIHELKKSKQEINRIDLLLNLAQFHILKPGEREIDLDSAVVYLNEAKEICRNVKSAAADGYLLLTESYLTKEKGNREDGKKNAEKGVKILEVATNKYYLGRAYYELSTYFDQWGDSLQRSKKIELVKLAIHAFTESGQLKYKAWSLEMLGGLYYNTPDAALALPILNQALALYDSIQYKNVQGVYMSLGTDYYSREDYGRALYFMLKALRTASLVNDTSMRLWRINNLVGKIYQDIDRQDISLKYSNDALNIAKKYKDDEALFATIANISITYNDLERYDEALKVLEYFPQKILVSEDPLKKAFVSLSFFRSYMKLNQFDRLQPFRDTLLKILDNSLIDDYRRANGYRVIATYYFLLKDYVKARYYLTKGSDLGNKLNYESSTLRDLKLWYQLDSAQGNFHSAYNRLLLFKTKMDSVTGVKKTRQFEVLTVEYELGMKEDSIKLRDKDIALLRDRNSLQQANLKQAGLIKNVTIVGIILASIIIGLLYRQFRQKQKSNNVITNKNEQLQHFLTEKEWLLKEIHHRVKNNLQIVMSLLNSQSAYIDNEPALTAIHDSQHRVHAMSLIHQKLYNTENVSSIDMSSYIRELATYLGDSFNTSQRIRFEYDIDSLKMDVSQAIPLGLILNEAITNSVKYAFPGNRDGIINISLSNTTPNHYLLIISDNGIGIPAHFTVKKPGSLGMSLMAGLSEDLDGNFSIENKYGTTIKISFVHDQVNRHDTLATPLISNNLN